MLRRIGHRLLSTVKPPNLNGVNPVITTTTRMESHDSQQQLDHWEKSWQKGTIGWHIDQINPILIANLDRLTQQKKCQNFFVPLAGKSLDIPYLLGQGHKVFGIEAVQQAIDELEVESQLGLKFDAGQSLYKTEDGRLQIYFGDFFKCPVENFGPFDCVWDRGSFIAMEYELRSAYVEVMRRSLVITGDPKKYKYHDFRYLLETVDYDREKYAGPPRAVDQKDIDQFYGDWTTIEILPSTQPGVEQLLKDNPEIGQHVRQVLYFMTPKEK